MKLSIVISTYNRAASLSRTLASVKPMADEIIVVDNESPDETTAVAKKFGAKVYVRPNNLMLNVNKNYGFTKASGDWILCLDDDEEITAELAREIKDAMKAQDVSGYWIPRKNIIFGRFIQHGIWWPDQQLRLFKKDSGRYSEKHVHEYIEVEGATRVLKNPYIHYNYDTLAQFLDKMQRVYTDSEVNKYIASGYRVNWRDAIRFPVSDFLKLYFAQSGYKDGLHGLVLAMLQGFYSFIIFVKLWEREKFREVDISPAAMFDEIHASGSDVTYWVYTAKMKEEKNPIVRLWYRLLRKALRTS